MKKKIDWYHALFAFLIHTIFAQTLGLILVSVAYYSGEYHSEMSIMDFQFTKIGIIIASSCQFVFFVLVPITYLKLIKRNVSDLILIKKEKFEPVFWAIIGTLAAGALIESILYELGQLYPTLNSGVLSGLGIDGELNFHELIAKAVKTDNFIILIGMILVVGVFPGFGEEFFYRGFMQNILIKRFNFFIAVLLSGGLFAGMHLFQQINQALSAFFISFFFGYMLYKSGNLLLPVLGHIVNNSFFVIMLFFNPDALDSLQKGYPVSVVIIAAILTPVSIYKFMNIKMSEK